MQVIAEVSTVDKRSFIENIPTNCG